MNQKSGRRSFRAILACVLVVAVALSAALLSGAVWDEGAAVHVDPATIESATLVVGTHLIHLSALTDSVYSVAQRSAEESGQMNIYYKSELADGAWFDISSATTLEDITTNGAPVENAVITALFFTHHTKSDGVTYDLRTGLAVDPRDINTPYDLESMEELFPLKTQYDLLRETQSASKIGKAKIARAAEFFSTAVITDATIRMDSELAALQVYYDVLNQNDGGIAERNEVQSVMDAVDAGRRAVVFGIVEEALATYLEELSTVSDSTDEEGNVSEGAMPDTTLQSAVSDSLNNIRASKISCEGKMLAAGTTVATGARYTYARALADHAVAKLHDACDGDVKNLLTLEHIIDGIYSDREAELGLLDGVLLAQAADAYSRGLSAGQSAQYNTAVGQNAADVLLRSITRDNTSTLNAYRNELEFFITAKTTRQSAGEASAYLDECLTRAQGWYALVPEDAFRAGAVSSVEAHIEFLTRLSRSLELSAGGNELDALVSEKADLQREMMSCLDGNDLVGAKNLENRIAGVDARIQALAGESLAVLGELDGQLAQAQSQLEEAQARGDTAAAAALEGQIGTLKGQIATLNNTMTGGTLGAQVAQIKSSGLSAVEDGDGNAARSSANALADLLGQDYGLVFPALRDLHSAMARKRDLDGSKVFDEGMNLIESAILNNADAYAAAMRTQYTADDLERIAADFFQNETGGAGGLFSPNAGTGGGSGAYGGDTVAGGDTSSGAGAGASVCNLVSPGATAGGNGTGDDLSSRSAAAAVELLALKMYCTETGSQEAANRLKTLARQELDRGGELIFRRVDDAGREYLPLTVLRAYTGMRYVWNQNLSQGTLAKGASYYSFTAYTDQVWRSRDSAETETMTVAAKFQNGVIHVYEDYTFQAFGVEAVYLDGTDCGVLCDGVLMERALMLFQAFLAQEGG